MTSLFLTALLGVAPGGDPWSASPDPTPAPRAGRPTAAERNEALDDVDKLLRRWPQERREQALERAARERWLARPPDAPETPDAPAPVIERGGGAKPSRYGKIIEVSPDAAAPPRSWTEEEIARLEQDQQSLDALKENDPKAFAREQARRKTIREGDQAWNAAVAKKWVEQEKAIEAEAERMQKALEVAKRKEAELQARRMGGSLDAQGNFVDPDLEEKK